MKRFRDFTDLYYNMDKPEAESIPGRVIREEAVNLVRDIVKRKNISIEDVKVVGVIEGGEFQFKAPVYLHQVKELTLIAYLMWFYEMKIEELQ